MGAPKEGKASIANRRTTLSAPLHQNRFWRSKRKTANLHKEREKSSGKLKMMEHRETVQGKDPQARDRVEEWVKLLGQELITIP
ncbi:hypothetical protein E3N88_01861 [Mikania micrantha]|uniref:Uncharacterized protein n=1 Tax=Mikania micrantha TaxID=192012 RepID=A0A5N6Q266_9ASTR|nr:hypothetical protein E3N88_01861 [Mikania micrantha]